MFVFILTPNRYNDNILTRGANKGSESEVLHMSEEDYKKIIIEIVSASHDMDYLIAVYTFAKHYPDTSKEKE